MYVLPQKYDLPNLSSKSKFAFCRQEEVSPAKITKCVRRVLFNQFVVQLPVAFLLQPLIQARGITYSAAFPSLYHLLLSSHLVDHLS
jgi:hypothetical protein